MLIASDLSFRYIERPIRSRGFLEFFRGPTRAASQPAAAAQPHGHRRGPHRRAGAGRGDARRPRRGAPAGIQVDHSKRITIIDPRARADEPARKPAHATTLVRQPAQSSSASPTVGRAQQPPFPRPVRVSFFGDSQGMTLLINKPNGLQNALTTSDSTVEGCGVLLGTIQSKVGFSPRPRARTAELAAAVAANTAAAPHRSRLSNRCLGRLRRHGQRAHARRSARRRGTPTSAQLAKGIKILIDSGAQVALMGVPCYRPIAAGGLPLLPERGYDNRTRHVTTLLAPAAAKDPHRVFMINPPAQFCHGPIATNTTYRWDGTHYYKPGAALVFQVITPQLLAIPQPPPH